MLQSPCHAGRVAGLRSGRRKSKPCRDLVPGPAVFTGAAPFHSSDSRAEPCQLGGRARCV